MYATTKSTTVEPPAVTLAIDLAKDVFELAFIDTAGLNDDLGSSIAKPDTRMQPPRLAEVEAKASAGANREL